MPRYDLITTAIYYYYFMFDSCGWVRNKKNTEWLNNEYFLYRNYKLESILLLTYHFICFLHWTVCNIGSVDLLSDNKCQQQKYKVHQACLNPIAWIPYAPPHLFGIYLVNFGNYLKIRYSLFTVAPHKKFASAHPVSKCLQMS